MATINGITTDIKSSALELIGNTPIVALDRIWSGPGRILAKCEFMNPGASIKCRSSLHMIKKALESGERIVKETGAYYVNQFNNEMNAEAHYETTGPEIWSQTGHRVDAFIATVGTAGTFTGASKYLKEKNPDVVCCVVEPEGSEPIKGCPITKPLHLLQGSGYGCVPNIFKFEYMDDTISVSDEETLKYKKLIGEKEGLFVGYTSAANIAAAVKLLESGKLPKDAWVVTLLNDTGLKYTPVPSEFKV